MAAFSTVLSLFFCLEILFIIFIIITIVIIIHVHLDCN